MDVNEELIEFREKGWEYSKGGLDPYIICPSGTIYRVEHLKNNGCPLCDQFLEDNPSFEKFLCAHSENDEREINGAKKFLDLVEKLERSKFEELHLFDD